MASQPSLDQIVSRLRSSLSDLSEVLQDAELTSAKRRKFKSEFEKTAAELNSMVREFDPVKRPLSVFDPGNPRTIGFFIALAMTSQPRKKLTSLKSSYGSGIYALYYGGNSELYTPIRNSETPIYVGQAAPISGGARTPSAQGVRITTRLNEHRKTIEKATNSLRVDDFEYRLLVVQSGWETPAEDYLIRLFKPVWNKETKIIQGFGKHGDSPSTRRNKVSTWDVLHAGRAGAGAGVNPDQKSKDQLIVELKTHFEKSKVYKNSREVLKEFLDALQQH